MEVFHILLGYKQKATPKYVVCNGDEGDPGAFMDRSVMEDDPHRMLEGMAIAGIVCGIVGLVLVIINIILLVVLILNF